MNESFRILEEGPTFKPIKKRISEIGLSGFHPSKNTEIGTSKSHLIIIEPKAFDVIAEHIAWGRKTSENINEQGGILIGEVYEVAGEIVGIARDAIPGKLGKGTAVHLDLNFHAWTSMLKDAEKKCTDDYRVIGWYHTHPNNLDVFFSGTDRDSQRRYFSEDWQFGIVLNPHRKIWCSFHGENSLPNRGFISEMVNSRTTGTSVAPKNEQPANVPELDQVAQDSPIQYVQSEARKSTFASELIKILLLFVIAASSLTHLFFVFAERTSSYSTGVLETMKTTSVFDSNPSPAGDNLPSSENTDVVQELERAVHLKAEAIAPSAPQPDLKHQNEDDKREGARELMGNDSHIPKNKASHSTGISETKKTTSALDSNLPPTIDNRQSNENAEVGQESERAVPPKPESKAPSAPQIEFKLQNEEKIREGEHPVVTSEGPKAEEQKILGKKVEAPSVNSSVPVELENKEKEMDIKVTHPK